MVDEGRIALRPAVELSYLTVDEQNDLYMALVIVFSRGKRKQLKTIDKRSFCLSDFPELQPEHPGFAITTPFKTATSVLSYRSISSVSIVTVIFYFVFKEKLSKKALAGLCLMVVGTLLLVFFK